MKYIKKLELNEFIITEKLARGLKPLLTVGSTINKKAGEDALVDLSDKFDRIDDEYAGDIASHLDMAIELMQDGYPGDATKKMKQFNKACKDVLNGKSIKSAFESVVNEKVNGKNLYKKIKKDNKTEMYSDLIDANDVDIEFYHKDVNNGKSKIYIEASSGRFIIWSEKSNVSRPIRVFNAENVKNMKDIDKQIKLYQDNGSNVTEAKESVNEAKYSKGYQKLGKLGYDDQFRSKVSLSKTLSEDLGFNPKKEFTEGVGFDNTSLYDVPTGNTIVANALNDEYTYDQLLKIAKDWYNKNESADVNEAKKFKPGDMWSNDFDYDGMMKYALKVNHKTSLKDLAKLHASATDVNYHTPFKGLGNAIDWITDDGVDSKEGKDFMKQFHNDIKDEIKKMK